MSGMVASLERAIKAAGPRDPPCPRRWSSRAQPNGLAWQNDSIEAHEDLAVDAILKLQGGAVDDIDNHVVALGQIVLHLPGDRNGRRGRRRIDGSRASPCPSSRHPSCRRPSSRRSPPLPEHSGPRASRLSPGDIVRRTLREQCAHEGSDADDGSASPASLRLVANPSRSTGAKQHTADSETDPEPRPFSALYV